MIGRSRARPLGGRLRPGSTSSSEPLAVPSALPLLARTRSAYRRTTLLRAALTGATLLLGAIAGLVLVDLLAPLPAPARRFLRVLPLAAGAAPVLLALHRAFPGPDRDRLALLVQERLPGLENMLSTALDATGEGTVVRAFRASAERRLADLVPAVPLRLGRPGAALGLCALATVGVLGLAPGTTGDLWRRWSRAVEDGTAAASRQDRTRPTPAGPIVDPRFGEIQVRIQPPAYTGRPVREWRHNGPIMALPGSTVRMRGRIPTGSTAIRAQVIGRGEAAVRHETEGWQVEWDLSAGERGLSLEALAGSRVVARRVFPLVLLEDHPPQVEWHAPDEDLIMATPQGEVAVWASVRDDYGVAGFWLAWIRSRGSGESFAFEEGRWEWARVRATPGTGAAGMGRGAGGNRNTGSVVTGSARGTDSSAGVDAGGSGSSAGSGTGAGNRVGTGVAGPGIGTGSDARGSSTGGLAGEYVLDLAAAGLEPGDVLHLRAVARDRNDVTGPRVGVSRTRVIRIAAPDQMAAATTLIGFPIDVPKQPLLSQRMIILQTERLRDRAPDLSRTELLAQAQRIADQQARLRGRVGDQVFTRATGAMQTPDTGPGFEETVGTVDPHGHPGGEPPHRQPSTGEPPAGQPPTAEPPLARPSAGQPATGEGAKTRAERVLEAASRATGSGTLEEIRHDHDGDPIVAVSQPLLDAYNAMWAAERELRLGAAAAALPHQLEALNILQQLRQAERVFLRGRVRVAPVDVAAARGTGDLDEADPDARSNAEPAPSTADRVAELDAVALRLRRLPPRDAALDLSALAVRVLGDRAAHADAADLLARAAAAAGDGEQERAVELLFRARAALAPRATAGRAPPVPAASDPLSARYFNRLRGGRP